MAHAIDHRGEIYTVDNIQQYLAIRNLMQNIRDSGEHTSGPSAFGAKDAQAFANSLNKFLQANNESIKNQYYWFFTLRMKRTFIVTFSINHPY